MTCRRLFSLILIFSIVEGSTLIFAPEVNGVRASGVSANTYLDHSLSGNQQNCADGSSGSNQSNGNEFKMKNRYCSLKLNDDLLSQNAVNIADDTHSKNNVESDINSDVKLFRSRLSTSKGSLISNYDLLMMNSADKHGIDWRFLSAIGYCESRFKADIYSKKGAIGLMQVMPATARIFGFTEREALDPEVNIEIATKMIRRIEKAMKISHLPDNDRLPLILASYNGGIGHVSDARRLAKKYGADPNKWSDVSRFLKLKSEQKYADDEVVKCGKFASGQTISFVNQVLDSYTNYCNKFTQS